MSERFTVDRVDREDGFAFSFHCSRYGPFTERLVLPSDAMGSGRLDDPAVAELLRLLHAVLGVSYYKAAAAEEIVLEDPPRTQAGRRLIETLYRDGLGEFYIRNALSYPPVQRFVYAGPVEPPRPPATVVANEPIQASVAWGGGKDSHVALRMLQDAGVATELVSVVLSDKVANVLSGTVSDPMRFIKRRIDAALMAANEAGALNGHVPITAINSLTASLDAFLTGRDWVAFANERSAEEGTRLVGGHAINHQFSKTLQCERLVRDALDAATGGRTNYFSILRPFSELWIARRVASSPEALRDLRSCNRNFFIAGGDGRRWCGECAKCAFTAVITAPFLSRSRSRELFGSDILNDEAVLSHVEDMAGLTDTKPWDCVGEVDEVRAALHRLAASTDWADALVVARVAPRVAALVSEDALEAAWSEALDGRGPHCLPDKLASLVQ